MHKMGIILCAVFVLIGYSLFGQDIIINEVQSKNTDTFTDDYGETPDWFELYNRGNEIINLAGYGITDDRDDLDKWIFPDIELASGEYLLVMASGRDIKKLLYWDSIIEEGDTWKYSVDGAKIMGRVSAVSPVMEKVKSLSTSFETVNAYAKLEIKLANPATV